MPWISSTSAGFSREQIEQLLRDTVQEAKNRICRSPKNVLLLPPDITRMHSGAGWMTEFLYDLLKNEAEVDVIPTLGQHLRHTDAQNQMMFGSIPLEKIHWHDWRNGCLGYGEVPADFVKQVTDGAADWEIPIWINVSLMASAWDLIINIGQVVPHEVSGFSNHNKNYFIGLGGKETICASHMVAVSQGAEANLGKLVTPLRQCFDKAEDELLSDMADMYIQFVMARDDQGQLVHTGYHAGNDRETFLVAARQSQEQNITLLEKPARKIVCLMREDEFFSTWVANKAIYRTRLAIADGGELIIVAPGLSRFGEQPDVDSLIRKHGYVGRDRVMRLFAENEQMRDLAHATAHLIHGSTEGRFKVTYAPGGLRRDEIEKVGYQYADLSDTLAQYPIDQLDDGYCTVNGEEVYVIKSPCSGMWATAEAMGGR